MMRILWTKTGEVRLDIFGAERDKRDDGLTSIILTPTEDVTVRPVLGETVTITFKVTGVHRQERA